MDESICEDLLQYHFVSAEDMNVSAMRLDEKEKFQNSDARLRKGVDKLLLDRRGAGIQGAVGDLECIIINTEPQNQLASCEELMGSTGFTLVESFEDPDHRTAVMRCRGSADILVRSRKRGVNPFAKLNPNPKTAHLPNTRLETYVFNVPNLDRYVEIQKARGVRFFGGILRHPNYSFVQTVPSKYTGNSLGFIQWHGSKGAYRGPDDDPLKWTIEEPDMPAIRKVGHIDHAATRLLARDRDRAILEFMELTNYDFDFAIYVKMMNSITSVTRLKGGVYAQVFTSGISPSEGVKAMGPTEKFVSNYGKRTHHIAFDTQNIEDAYEELVAHSQGFLIGLVGSPEEGLKQTFTMPSKNTFLVNEYIHRYGDFDGFFTRSNVTLLTESTDKQ
jgi:4-hydroxyphenylpyruvate dioxygenase-like putative hemolysin